MACDLNERMYQILVAQQANIARIKADLILEGTTGNGDQILLNGPRPDLIRLHDQPLRFAQDSAIENWERLITLTPTHVRPAARITSRTDRDFGYQVQILVRLTDREQFSDREQLVQGGKRQENPLSEKLHRLLQDFHHVFFDDQHLVTDECPQGLVDDADYSIAFEPGVEYPMALVTLDVVGTAAAW